MAALLVAAIAMAAGLTHPPSAYACNPGRTNLPFASHASGWGNTAYTAPTDVSMSIYTYSPYVASGSTVAWDMLAWPGASDWAQIGWLQDSSGSRNTFVQVNDAYKGGVPLTYWGTPTTVGTTHTYLVHYNAATFGFEFSLDGARFPNSSYSSGANFYPSSVQAAGEVFNYDSQMPGAASGTLEAFTSATEHDANGWHNFFTFATAVVMEPFYGNVNGGSTSGYIYDTGC